MQARKVQYISRPEERLIGAPEAAQRMGIDVRVARQIMRVYGVKIGSRYYITQTRLHEALVDMQGKKGSL